MATTVGDLSVSVVVKGNTDTLLKQTELNVRSALKAMADATLQRALVMTPAVPVKNGDLSSTGLVYTEDNGLTAITQFGNGLKYGRYQEYGAYGDKYTGSKTDWDYTTAGTGAFFLQTAGNSVAKEGIKNYI